MIDYRGLLVRYMAHVGCEEGVTHVPVFGSRFIFTEEEIAELQKIDAEASDLGKQTPSDVWHMRADDADQSS